MKLYTLINHKCITDYVQYRLIFSYISKLQIRLYENFVVYLTYFVSICNIVNVTQKWIIKLYNYCCVVLNNITVYTEMF